MIELFRKKPLANINLEELARQTLGFTGAEIEAVCNEAALKGLEEIMEVAKTDEEVFFALIKLKHISMDIFISSDWPSIQECFHNNVPL